MASFYQSVAFVSGMACAFLGCSRSDHPNATPGPDTKVPAHAANSAHAAVSGAPRSSSASSARPSASNDIDAAPGTDSGSNKSPLPRPASSGQIEHHSCPNGMAHIPGGVFIMGAPYALKPTGDYFRHRVAVRSFCIDITEVTVQTYRACTEAGKCKPSHKNGFSCTIEKPGQDDHPINCIDWEQAKQVCAFGGKRLPTEQQWEYAARGGKQERTYSWGGEPPTEQRSCYNHPGTCRAKSFGAGAFGLYGMTGNVWEWTSSSFGMFHGHPLAGQWRVYRGGSYSRRFPKWMKAWVRNRFHPTQWGAHLGVRCVADVAGATCPEGASWSDVEHRCVLPAEEKKKPARLASKTTRTSAHGKTRPAASTHAPKPSGPKPMIMRRDPQFDADCRKYKPGRPVAYLIDGGTFAMRQKRKRTRGCSNRDVNTHANSVCCPK